jgi:hypothetical protein
MAVFCITSSNPEFQKLLAESGQKPLVFEMMVSKWMTNNEVYDRYPTLEELGISQSMPQIKPGVEELFDENPELANQVYEALGFEIPTTKLQGKQFEYGEPRFFDVVEELASGERANLPSSILINKLLKGKYLPEIKESQIILGLSEAGIWRPNIKKIEAFGENKSTLAKKIGHELLHSVTNNIILSYQNLKGVVDFTDKYYKDFIKQGYIKPVDLSKSQIEALDNLVRIRNKVVSYVEQNKDKIQKQDRGFGTYDYFIRTNYTESETDLHEFISEVFTNPELINILKEIPTEGKKSNLFKDFVDAVAKILGFTNTSILEDVIAYSEEAFFKQPQITPQQKQQAQQLYSQYLDTIFPNSKVKDIVYHIGGINKNDKFDRLKIGPYSKLDMFYFSSSDSIFHIKNELDYLKYWVLYGTTSKSTKDLVLKAKTKEEVIKIARENIKSSNLESNIKQGLNQGTTPWLSYENMKDTIYGWGDFSTKSKDIVRALINVKNPITESTKNAYIENPKKGLENIGKYPSSTYVTIGEYDSYLISKQDIGVKNPEQIHILGSKQDIEGFKEFVGNVEDVATDIGLDMSSDEAKAFNSLVNDGTISIKCE